MGDRANVFLPAEYGERRESGDGVYLYTHWSGYELPVIVREALTRGKEHWDDSQYLGRIVFCQMVEDREGLTGFGISAIIGDGGYRVIVVDAAEKMVRFAEEDNERTGPYVHEVSFEDYISLSDKQVRELFGIESDDEDEGEDE